jgi:hypothetical protein
MGFRLHDLLFAIICIAIGAPGGLFLSSHLPGYLRAIAGFFAGLCVYLALIYPFYRALKLLPMVLPRCPCCQHLQQRFYIIGGCWPRICYRCPSCDGEFVIWHNGRPGNDETWEMPVLLLKWPYAFGIYKRSRMSECGAAAGISEPDS